MSDASPVAAAALPEDGPAFLGRGWAYPTALDDRGRTAMASGERKVAQAIGIILETARGERVMRPTFGCGIHEFVFAAMDESTVALACAAVREALVLWEPRIDVLSVAAEPIAADQLIRSAGGAVPRARLEQDALLVSVDYRIRATNNEYNLVYPFYLRAGA